MAAAASVRLDSAEINRANSRNSTGPRTEAGKHRSSQNALRHGLTAQSVVVPAAEQAAYQQLCTNFFDEYKPATLTEAAMVQQLADTTWRLNRILQLEDTILTDDSLPPQAAIDQLSRLGLYSSRLSRRFLNTVKQLREIQDHRRQRDRQGTQRDPADDGFVFSSQQVDHFTTPEMHLNNASAAIDLPPRPLAES